MNTTEYNAMKKLLAKQAGADDADSLIFYAEKMLGGLKFFKFGAIFFILIGIPLSLVLIGIPFVIIGLALYFFMYRKPAKKQRAFIEHVKNDPTLAKSLNCKRD